MGDTMKKDSLLFFENPYKFQNFIDSLEIYNGWKIQKGILNERGKRIEDKLYTKRLRKLFRDKNLFRKEVSLAEVVSWLDNLVIIYKLLDNLKKKIPEETFNNISIYAEYKILLSKKMRVDYMFVYLDMKLLIEMRTVNRFDKIKPAWDKKMHELMVYKELMGNYMVGSNIRLYAFVALFEFEGGNPIEKHIAYNNNQIEYLSKYILEFVIRGFVKKVI